MSESSAEFSFLGRRTPTSTHHQSSLSPPSTPLPSSPFSSPSRCSVSTNEGDCRLPLTPDSNLSHSGGVYRTGLKSNTHKPYNHPYAHPASFEDDDIFDRMIGRPCNNNVEEMNQATTDVFLQGLKGLSHDSLCHAVHYKEAVYQRKCTCVEMAKRELDETSKLHTLLHSISRDTDLEAAMAESERNFFMRMLVDRQATLPHPSTNISYSLAAQARDKKALGQTDAELTLLQCHVKESKRPFTLSVERIPIGLRTQSAKE
ncbi:hypothetical protein EV702DRAFT_1203158 [Suillus placidus]|uniref:Uncharacterized protein n=1 Tax=Suillus placidus TaxID=48579 RepID=A0A9P7CXM6_9AGAM|nr:hypothetical protein EV702DRAFT_1203158 [Suillus placidus]